MAQGKASPVCCRQQMRRAVGPLPWDEGCSRKHIIEAVEASLRRLDTDYLDLFQVHVFDRSTPIEETLEALDILVRTGKVRYVGCSNWFAYQVALALGLSDSRRITRFSSVQPRHSLLHRPAERELFPLCLDQGIGVITYNPLAGGLLTGKHNTDYSPLSGTRFALSPVYRDLYWHERSWRRFKQFSRLAESAGVSVTTLSIAWSLTHQAITSTIIGATRPDQLAESTAARRHHLTLTSRWNSTVSPGRTWVGPRSESSQLAVGVDGNRLIFVLGMPLLGEQL